MGGSSKVTLEPKMVDISKWPVRKVMRLPDWCFGDRWPISLHVLTSIGAWQFDIAGLGCGDVFVLWDLWIYGGSEVADQEHLRLTMGQALPATMAENSVNEDLLPDFGRAVGVRRVIGVWVPCYLRFPLLRMPIALNGRRVILEVEPDSIGQRKVWCGMVVSELPKEVPEWVLSGSDRSLL